jgi:predicted TIM-barrel fold metal-dependent hydrolase
MIDTHIHVVRPHLPGVGALSPRLDRGTEHIAGALRAEMKQARVDMVLAMGRLEAGPADPLGVAETLAVARLVPGLFAIGVADPLRGDADHLRRVEAELMSGRVRALKVYLGYLHFGPDHAGYRPYYELAERYRLPVIFHTGDTYSPCAKLRYAQPLLVDDVAVDHPRVNFVLAHLGYPWLIDAAEVVYKNVNVFADVSGLLIGSAEEFAAEDRSEMRTELATELRRAFRYAERPTRFLFGSDWPLAPMAAYRDFIAEAIPTDSHSLVFGENAQRLFRL